MAGMQITFLGAADAVTGSRHLVDAGGARVLLDCGLFQGYKTLRERNWAPFPVEPSTITAVVLSHTHPDHSGYVPALVKEGFRGKVFASPATRDLAEVLLQDSAHLQGVRATVRRGGSVLLPSFAVGRAQALLLVLQRLRDASEIPADLPIYLDSPMATQATALYQRHAKLLRIKPREAARLCDGVTLVAKAADSEKPTRRADNKDASDADNRARQATPVGRFARPFTAGTGARRRARSWKEYRHACHCTARCRPRTAHERGDRPLSAAS